MAASLLPAASGAASPPTAPAARPFTFGMIIFEKMTNLDFVGPNQTFAGYQGAKIHVLGKTLDPIVTDTGCRIMADTTLKDAPQLDLIFIGGGGGVVKMMEDREVMDFLRDRAPSAQWITSVCTGALVLGAAGLLRGYKATTHWTAMEVLPYLGATPVEQRVVFDRNRVTGGGVTAGIDFGLAILARLAGEKAAMRNQLFCEYDPQPPFHAGSPKTAPPDVVAGVLQNWGLVTQGRIDAAKRAAARFT
jgi:cyclohexyl-isocyanide hydratase